MTPSAVSAIAGAGALTLGLDPTTIKYVVVSHAHSDHVGGAAFLQDGFGACVVMSEEDWNLLARAGGTWRKPKRDVVATDGQRLVQRPSRAS